MTTARAIEVLKDFRQANGVELQQALDKAIEVMGSSDKLTPLVCTETKVQLYIGDYVEDSEKRCGTLQFDSYINSYVIKTKDGGNIKTKHFRKIQSLYDYKIINGNVECRKSNRIGKW